MVASMQSFEGKVHELLKDYWKENGRSSSYGVGRAIFATLILEIQIPKEIVLKIAVKIYSIS